MIERDVKLSGRAKRMAHFTDMHRGAGLNLVSLMDIFTILVFFLLVSSGSQQLPSTKAMTLPTTVAKKVPKETLIIAVTKEDILVNGKKVLSIADALKATQPVLGLLEEELKFQSTNKVLSAEVKEIGLPATIMGDESIPYELLSKILATCRQANYTQIAFAAFQKARG